MTGYAISGGDKGDERLLAMAEVHGEGTRLQLVRSGVGPGMRCLDVGCGAGSVTLDLAAMVGTSGHVLGVDLDEVKLERARAAAAEAGIEQVEFRAGDATALDEPPEYDVVYARFLLQHLRDPEDTLRRMWAAVRPGGLLLVEDTDFAGYRCQPADPAFDFFIEMYTGTVARRGGDAMIGRRLPALFAAAGIEDADAAGRLPVGTDVEHKRMALTTLEATGDSVLAERLTTPVQLRGALDALRDHLDDVQTITIGPDVISVWARRPADDE